MTSDPCFIYARISRDPKGDELGVQRQEELCRKYADEHGLTVTEVFVDNDISAYSGKLRPAYEEMLVRLRAREVFTVLVQKTDRLYRRTADLGAFVDACRDEPSRSARPDVATIAVHGGGRIDLSTSEGRLHARNLASFAEYESEVKSDRLRAKFAQLARSGGYSGGPVPFGWKVQETEDGGAVRVIDEDKAAAVADAARDVLAGVPIGLIMRRWNGRGWTGARGAPFSQTTVRNILKRPINAGYAVHQGKALEDVPGPWPRIMDPDLWRGVTAFLNNPDRNITPTNTPVYRLSGIAQCWCSAPLYSAATKVRGQQRRIYRCKATGGGHVSKSVPLLDALVMRHAALLYAMIESDAAQLGEDQAAAAERGQLESDVSALLAQLDGLARLAGDGTLTPANFARASTAVEVNLSAKRARQAELAALAASVVPTVDPEPVSKDHPAYLRFESLPIDEVRTFLRRHVNVVCWPGRGGFKDALTSRAAIVFKMNTVGPGLLNSEDIAGVAEANGRPIYPGDTAA